MLITRLLLLPELPMVRFPELVNSVPELKTLSRLLEAPARLPTTVLEKEFVPLEILVVFPGVLLPTTRFCPNAGRLIPPRRQKHRNPLRMDS